MTTYLNEDQRGSGYHGSASKQSLGSQAAADSKLDHGGRWEAPPLGDKEAYVLYSFRSNASADEMQAYGITGFHSLTGLQMAAVESALGSWSDVANIFFTRSGNTTYGNSGDLLFGDYTGGAAGAAAFATYPSGSDHDVWFNITQSENQYPVLGSYGYLTVVHEIGHAIGLSHPGTYNADPTVSITYANDAEYFEDTVQYSVMSYFEATESGGFHLNPDGSTRYASAPMMDDITAIQDKYGANMLTRVGNDTYGFNASNNVPNYYNSTNGALVFCVWDAAGTDTFDFSGYSTSQLIDLRSGHFSNVGGMRGNVSIAINATIENAKAGSGGDIVHGNETTNLIYGGGGNDTLYGYGGDDVFIGSDGQDYIDGGAGFDTLSYATNSVSGVHATATGVSPEMGDDWSGSTRVAVNAVESIITTNQKDLIDVRDGSVIEYKALGGEDTFRLYYPLSSSLILLDGGDGNDDLDMSTSVGPYTPVGVTVYVDVAPPGLFPGQTYYQTIHAIDIESIKGSMGGDTFFLSEIKDGLTIDGNGAPYWSLDTVDFSLATSGISGSFAGIKNIATFKGSSLDDTFDIVGAQTIYGNGGEDTFVARGSGTRMYGGSDPYIVDNEIDTLDLTSFTTRASIVPQDGGWYYPNSGYIKTSSGFDWFLGMDRILVGDAGADIGNLSDVFKGEILGGSGDDRFVAAAGISFDGGSGHDTVNFAASNDSLEFDGSRLVFGGSGLGPMTKYEHVIGTTRSDIFRGGDGMTFEGNGGPDTFHSGRGGSTYFGYYQPYGGYQDTMILDEASTVQIAIPFASDPRTGVRDDHGNVAYGLGNLIGSTGDDLFIIGADGRGELPYRIDGGGGRDTLRFVGATYFDASFGGFSTPGSPYYSAFITGFSRFIADAGSIAGTAGDDEMFANGTSTMNGGAGNDVIWTSGSASAGGGAGNDVLYGNGVGSLDGGDGDDVIYAGAGTTYVSGGMGDDIIHAENSGAYISDQYGINHIFGSPDAKIHFRIGSYESLVSMKDVGAGVFEIKTSQGTTYVEGVSDIYIDAYDTTSAMHLYAGLNYQDGVFL